MRRKYGFAALIALLIVVTGALAAATARIRSTAGEERREAVYLDLERAYVSQMREYLDEKGLVNSGVMLTRTVYENGSREYHVFVHNSRMERLGEAERKEIEEGLFGLAFEYGGCSFWIELAL